MERGRILVLYQFVDFTLEQVSLSFDSSAFTDVLKAYTAKFGSTPHRRRQESIVTRAGVPYTNEIVSWDTDVGEFTLQKYGNKVTDGFALISSPKGMRYLERQKDIEQRDLGNRL